jgi:ERCC4-type nuclease
MSEIVPTIIQDTQEKRPFVLTGYPVEIKKLPVGDYGIRSFSDWNNPAFIVERKSLSDLIGSLTNGKKRSEKRRRERFMREIEKLRQFRFAALLIEASRADMEEHSYTSQATPQSILASLDAIQVRCGIHVLWAGDSYGAARRLEGLVRQFVKGIEKDFKRLAA